jgi:hypothetical protein
MCRKSNPHSRRNTILSRARPVPTLSSGSTNSALLLAPTQRRQDLQFRPWKAAFSPKPWQERRGKYGHSLISIQFLHLDKFYQRKSLGTFREE